MSEKRLSIELSCEEILYLTELVYCDIREGEFSPAVSDLFGRLHAMRGYYYPEGFITNDEWLNNLYAKGKE